MKPPKQCISFILAMCSMILLSGCGGPTPYLASIQVTPGSASVGAGTSAQFTAVGTYQSQKKSPYTVDVTNQVTWSSSIPTVATVNSNGLATGVGAGTTTVTAAIGGVLGTAEMTVTGSSGGGGNDLMSIAIIPTAGSQTLETPGETAQFIAIGTFSGSPATQDLTNKVTWSSSDVRVATINASGLATDVGSVGQSSKTTIVAIGLNSENATITGTSDLTVNNIGQNILPTLTLYKVGQGTGTVTSSPGGINCGSGSGCTAHFTLNATVTLTATPDQGSVFGGWSANCSPSNSATCSLQMPDNATVGVIFNQQ